jgi:outer membrane lipoprotein-sorting protein
MRNDFSNVRINPRLDKSLFDYDLAGFKITDGRP